MIRAKNQIPADAPLPSLNALRAFEATARHLSFSKAARELCVTQTAVSHQVRQLEAELGATLFRRTTRHVALTPTGTAWAFALGDVFSRLHSANRRLRRVTSGERATISVSVVPSFGSRWLIPRLGKFLSKYSDYDIRISVTERLVDFSEDGVDVGIRYGQGRYPGTQTDKLSDDAWVVVCAPGFDRRNVKRPKDLRGQTLLYDDDDDAWNCWFRSQRQSHSLPARYTQITDSSLLVDAAVRGQGIALARWSLAVDELGSGRLVPVFSRIAPLPTGRAFYLSMPRENLRRPEISAFRAWVREEVRSLTLPRQHASS